MACGVGALCVVVRIRSQARVRELVWWSELVVGRVGVGALCVVVKIRSQARVRERVQSQRTRSEVRSRLGKCLPGPTI